ncbi:von Willebrand factor type A [Deinococcus proteolyticus MRP]|uniref:von Willebrand factor type A n=1 Tax=Deinococcus proteolyticus (strain ATCC 35074 / DSM 20540 / JCM 6276 / NBRC 101906 / NCIMB 13154 / VKM Ac-1939 / CCM 2703 / MRP) TaxID=693977 RepID=F0RLG3_DEIPM|nr:MULTISPECIES: VWA domain-containing protein [Deinococcus]ADY25867.1 von Willebrand factor type A [Deinococcus proteolyticus MRP]MCY1701990.1 VWA domain-containing protein [Deinococcus sp. SL84]
MNCRAAAWLPAVLLAAALGGCTDRTADAGATPDTLGERGPVLNVMAGSELKDLEPLLDEVAGEVGVRLNMRYTGTLDGVAELQAGAGAGNSAGPDLVWFSHAKYLELQGGLGGRILSSEKIMLSPVVLGVKESDAKAWGWDTRPVGWKDIAARVASGDLHYGMANPAASNSGMTALIGITAALSGKGDAITAGDVQAGALKQFFKGQVLTSGSSGWLADAYVADQGRSQLNGLINYESVLLSLNRGGRLQEPLKLIYPSDGLVTADYPLMLLNDARRSEYQALVDRLRSPQVQQRIMQETLRRPAAPGVALSSEFPPGMLVELPFPASAGTIDAILGSYLNDVRRPANTIFVLDVSGSMEGKRLEALKAALGNLSGADTSLGWRFAAFADRERVTLIPFSGDVEAVRSFQVNKASRAADLQAIAAAGGALQAGGGTNIYGALSEAYRQAAAAPAGSYTSVVLMTDGEGTAGPSLNEFRDFYAALPAGARSVKTFTVLFGDSDVQEMNEVAALTGGRTFDGQQNLAAAFKEIRGYQ